MYAVEHNKFNSINKYNGNEHNKLPRQNQFRKHNTRNDNIENRRTNKASKILSNAKRPREHKIKRNMKNTNKKRRTSSKKQQGSNKRNRNNT